MTKHPLDDLGDDIRDHIERETAENIERGMSPEDARNAARRAFGSTALVQDQARDVWVSRWLQDLSQDLRYALRALRKSPSFTAVVISTLAIGIAANTTLLSVINGVMFKPIDASHPEELIVVTRFDHDRVRNSLSAPDYYDLRQQSQSLSELAGFTFEESIVTSDDDAGMVYTSRVTDNFFPMLGTKATIGRLFDPSEASEPLMVLAYPYWQRVWHGEPSVIGKTAVMNGQRFTIVGVTPASFIPRFSIVDVSAYVPLASSTSYPAMRDCRGCYAVHAMGRLKTGATPEQAEQDLRAIATRLEKQYPETNGGLSVRVFEERWSRPEPSTASVSRVIVGLLMALVGLLSTIVCVNVANLALVRMAARRRELAVRLALGASRARLFRQLATEYIAWSLLAGIVAYPVTFWLSAVVSARVETGMSVPFNLRPDGLVIAYGFALAILNGLLITALSIPRDTHTNDALHHESVTATASARTRRLHLTLASAQVGLVFALVVVAGLFIKSAFNVTNIDLGFKTDGIVTFTFDPEQVGLNDAQTETFYRDLSARIAADAAVKQVTFASGLPMWTGLPDAVVKTETDKGVPIAFNRVSGDYFSTVGIALTRGRTFSGSDMPTSGAVAIVSETMARRLWPGQDPIGRHFTAAAPEARDFEVVGVVRDFVDRAIFREPGLFYFVPLSQAPVSRRILHVQSNQPLATVVADVRRVAAEINADVPAVDIAPMTRVVEGFNGRSFPTIVALIVGILGGVGLCVALIGVYGVVSFGLVQRTREFAIRLALGATSTDIVRLALSNAIVVGKWGLVGGVVLAMGLAYGVAPFLLNVGPLDPLAYVVGAGILGAVIVLACLAPAYRATRLNPTVALRSE